MNPNICRRAPSRVPMARNQGFTLVELLVVIAIIGILIGMLLPAVQQVREAARRSACSNKMKQASLAIHNYESSFQKLPQGADYPAPIIGYNAHTWGWAAHVLPYMEQSSLADQIDYTASLAAPHNHVYAGVELTMYICPSDPDPTPQIECCSGFSNGARLTDDIGGSSYAGCHGSNSMWATDGSRGNPDGNGVLFNHNICVLGDIKDGTSNTLLLGEATEIQGEHPSQGEATFGVMWANWGVQTTEQGINGPGSMPGGRDLTLDPIGDGENRHDEYFRESGFSSWHPAGAMFTFSDASVHFLSESIDQNTFDALGSRAGGEVKLNY